MTHHAPSGTDSSNPAPSEESNNQPEKIFCLRIVSAKQREVSRSLSHEGASSIAAFYRGLKAGLRTYRHFPLEGIPTNLCFPACFGQCIHRGFRFLFTAAGQFWVFTRFPISTLVLPCVPTAFVSVTHRAVIHGRAETP